MANIWDAALNLAASDTLTFGIIILAGFLLGHIVDAILFGYIYQFGKLSLDKIIKFVTYLLFLKPR